MHCYFLLHLVTNFAYAGASKIVKIFIPFCVIMQFLLLFIVMRYIFKLLRIINLITQKHIIDIITILVLYLYVQYFFHCIHVFNKLIRCWVNVYSIVYYMLNKRHLFNNGFNVKVFLIQIPVLIWSNFERSYFKYYLIIALTSTV